MRTTVAVLVMTLPATVLHWPAQALEGGPAVVVQDEKRGAAEDIKVVKEFLAALPPNCAKTTAKVAPDRTVRITLLCVGNSKRTQAQLHVKNGVVTKLEDTP